MNLRSLWTLRLVGTALIYLGASTSVVLAQFGPAKVTVTKVQQLENVSSGRAFVGTVEPRRRSAVGSAVGGRVVEFKVHEGQRVEKGQALAQLLTRNLDIQVSAARAEHELRRQELRELENGSREEERREAEGKMKAAEALMRYAKAKLERTKSLLERNATTPDRLDEDTTAFDTTADNYRAAKASYDLVMAGPRVERIAQATARMASAEEEVNRLLDLLEKHTIVSPFDGYVVAEHTEVGQWINTGELVAEVIEVDPIEIRLPVGENYIPRLSLGVTARVEIEALPQETFVGTVSAIVPRADERARSFPVKITLDNREQSDGTPLIKAGMFARVWLPVDQKSNVLVVPKDSLVLGGPQPVVFVAEEDAKTKKHVVRPVPVQLGIALGSWIEVRGELRSGQTVVVEGNERLRPGAEIVAVPAKVAPPVAAAENTNRQPESSVKN